MVCSVDYQCCHATPVMTCCIMIMHPPERLLKPCIASGYSEAIHEAVRPLSNMLLTILVYTQKEMSEGGNFLLLLM